MITIDATYHGLDFGLVLALLATSPDTIRGVVADPSQGALWLAAQASFPNTLGQPNNLMTLYQNSPITFDTLYDQTRVGVTDISSNILAEIINLAIPE